MGTSVAFGLAISADRPVPFLGSVGDGRAERELRLELSPRAAPDWGEGELISDERRRDGVIEFQIEALGAGYRIHGPEYGTCLIDAGGAVIWGQAGKGGAVPWQRLLVAQSLPFAAVLQGLEVFHASAVRIGSEAIAFSGPSGSGKTSLALALQRQGAGLLADDVLAVERVGGEVVAHRGAPITGVDRAEVERLRSGGVEALGEVLGANDREVLVRTVLAPAPVRLGALFFLERPPDGPPTPRFEAAADARPLLASTFNLLVASPERLAGQLEICAMIAQLRVERVVCGPATSADELAGLIQARLGEPR